MAQINLLLKMLVIPFLLMTPHAFAGSSSRMADFILNYKVTSNAPDKVLQVSKNKQLIESTPHAPCETLEIRVAASSGEDLVFKEGVGSLFTVGADLKRKYILTVAHLIAYQQALIGVCNGKVYGLKPVAADTTIDTAVLEVVNPDGALHQLFNYSKGRSPQIFEVERYLPQRAQSSSMDLLTYFAADFDLLIETLQPDLFKSGHRLFVNKVPHEKSSRSLEMLDRREFLPKDSDGLPGLDFQEVSLLPGSPLVYLLKVTGVKPGMSGSPIFFSFQGRLGYDPEPVMVGVVSKTKINDTKTALIPFNVIYKNLELLLSGQSNNSIYTSNDTLYVQGQFYQNLGAGDFKNSADEIKFPEKLKQRYKIKNNSWTVTNSTKASPSEKLQYRESSSNKKALEDLLKDPKKIPSSRLRYQEKSTGVDWGDGNGDLLQNSSTENFKTSLKRSIFIDPTIRENSGVVDASGTTYYGILKDGRFIQVKSIFSLLKYAGKNLDVVLKKEGITNKADAFKTLCASPLWQKQASAIYYNREDNVLNDDSLGFLPPISNNPAGVLVVKPIYAHCERGTMEVAIDSYNIKAHLYIDDDTVSGKIDVMGCSKQIKVSSKNLWERNISTEDFTGTLEIGDSKESLIKINIFKLHRICKSTSPDVTPIVDRPWPQNTVFGMLNLWMK